VISDPAGGVKAQALRLEGHTRQARARCDEAGVYRPGGDRRGGPRHRGAGELPHLLRRRATRGPGAGPRAAAPADAAAPDQEIFRRTNEVRAEAGLPPLRLTSALSDVARGHSDDMRRAGFVGHVSPTTGNAADRVARAGLAYSVVRENVARAYSAAEAMAELLNSPAHRGNILARDVAQIGVGVVVDRRGDAPALLVTQLFLQAARPYNPSTAAREVLELIDRQPRRAGVPALQVAGELNRLAAAYVRAITHEGRSQREADARLGTALRGGSGLSAASRACCSGCRRSISLAARASSSRQT